MGRHPGSIVLALLAVLAAGPHMSAGAWTGAGTCSLIVTFNFTTPVWGSVPPDTFSAPNYTITIAPAADLNPLTEPEEPCLIAWSGPNAFRTTSVIASGAAIVWTCEAVAASGGWMQSWSPSPAPSDVDGSHVIIGGPDALTLRIEEPSVSVTSVGMMELTIHPDDALKLAQCETSSITSLKMIGTLEFAQR